MGEVRWLPILVAAVANMVVGALWYSNALFLPAWKRAAGREPSRKPDAYVVSAIAALVGAYVVAWFVPTGVTAAEAVTFGALLGVLIAWLSLGVNYAFAERGGTLLAIDGGFHATRFIVMALVIGLWP